MPGQFWSRADRIRERMADRLPEGTEAPSRASVLRTATGRGLDQLEQELGLQHNEERAECQDGNQPKS